MSEKVKIKIARNVVHLPAIALRGLVVFPNNVVHFEVGRTKSIAAIEAAMHANSSVFLVAQREMDEEEPALHDLYAYGVIAEIKQVLRVSDDLVKVLVEGKEVDLTASEFKLLTTLSRYPGRVYSRMELVEKVLGYDFEGYERTIDSHVKNLRAKIGDNPRNPKWLHTVHGVGYRFEDPTKQGQ